MELSVLAKICKVPIVESTFFDSGNGLYEDYSAINANGRLTHIHYIIDSWEKYEDFLKKMQEHNDKVFKTDFSDIDNDTMNLWEFSSINTTTMVREFHGNMQLNNNGTIGIYNNTNEKYWERSKEDVITLFDQNRTPTSLLYPQNNQVYLGDFLLDEDNKWLDSHFIGTKMKKVYYICGFYHLKDMLLLVTIQLKSDK